MNAKTVHLVVTTAAVVAIACGGWHRARADGFTEYALVDGGWAGPGDGCGCAHVQDQILTHDETRVLLECVPNPEFGCDARTLKLPDGGACPAATACFGWSCCVWACPQAGCE